MKNLNEKLKYEKGITLIALVVTIIVLLLLAGVTISTLTGDNSILNKVKEARKVTEIAEVKELARIDITNWVAEKSRNGEDATLSNTIIRSILIGKDYVKTVKDQSFISEKGEHEILYSELYESSIKYYTTDGVPIPNGFYYVGGTKEEGVIISDNSNDENKGTSHNILTQMQGNQFVWIPVDPNTFDTKFKRTKPTDGTEAYFSEVGGDGKNTISEITESEKTTEEAKKMYASVKKNCGFYIGRYETGLDQDETIVVKQGVQPYNNIPWSSSDQLNIDTGGAVEQARNFAVLQNYTSVNSTLCYGVEWDAALNFMDSNYITNETDEGYPNCDINSFVINSANKGNYTEDENMNEWKGKITLTGSIENYQEKNIYDMAGNLREWTMEVFYSPASKSRVLRGGCYALSGKSNPASSRENYAQSTNYGSFGFRICLYLN